jgi:monoamine oxidase
MVKRLDSIQKRRKKYDQIIRVLTRRSGQVPLDNPWSAPRAEEYGRMTADDSFFPNAESCHPRLSAGVCTKHFHADAYQISLLYLSFYLHSGDNYDTGFESAAQAWTVKETMHEVAQCVARELGNTIVLNAPVRSISQDSTSLLVTSDAGEWRCEYAIVAMPLPLSLRIV